jgi:hypothetical protein
MMVGTHEEGPQTQTVTIRLWEWQGGMPMRPVTTSDMVGRTPPMKTTTTYSDLP